jgi:hypothetical protein
MFYILIQFLKVYHFKKKIKMHTFFFNFIMDRRTREGQKQNTS